MKRLAWIFCGALAAAAGAVTVQTLLASRKSPVPAVSVMRPMFDMGAATHGPYANAVTDLVQQERVVLRPDDLPEFGVELYWPRVPERVGLPIVVYVHGGGFIGGSTDQIEAYCEVLASEGYVVASVDYTLAPRLRFPGAVRQVIETLRALPQITVGMDGDPTRTVIAGDSAGAHIAACAAAALANAVYAARLGEDLPGDGTVPAQGGGPTHVRAALLFCGPYEVQSQWDTLFPGVSIYLHAYTGRRDWRSWEHAELLAPNRWVTAAFPPTFLTVGDADPLARQTRVMEAALAAEGVEVESLYWRHRFLPHEYQRELNRPEAREALRRTLAFLDSHLFRPTTKSKPKGADEDVT